LGINSLKKKEKRLAFIIFLAIDCISITKKILFFYHLKFFKNQLNIKNILLKKH